MPARAGVEEVHSARGRQAGDVEAGDLVAQFEGHLERRHALARVGGQRELHLAEPLAAGGESLHDAGPQRSASALDLGDELAVPGNTRIEAERLLSVGTDHHSQVGGASRKRDERVDELATVAIVEAVRQPDDALSLSLAESPLDRHERRLARRLERLRADGGGRLARGRRAFELQRDRLRRVRRGRDDDRPRLALGLVYERADGIAAQAPATRTRPAVVDDDHDRAGADDLAALLRIEHRLGKRQNDERRCNQAKQRQPPRAARRCLLLVLQLLENPRRREADAAGARRRRAQQPPDDGQRGECRKQQGIEEAERADGHVAPPGAGCGRDFTAAMPDDTYRSIWPESRACSASRVSSAGRSV